MRWFIDIKWGKCPPLISLLLKARRQERTGSSLLAWKWLAKCRRRYMIAPTAYVASLNTGRSRRLYCRFSDYYRRQRGEKWPLKFFHHYGAAAHLTPSRDTTFLIVYAYLPDIMTRYDYRFCEKELHARRFTPRYSVSLPARCACKIRG